MNLNSYEDCGFPDLIGEKSLPLCVSRARIDYCNYSIRVFLGDIFCFRPDKKEGFDYSGVAIFGC